MEPSVGGPASGSSSGSEARGLPWAEGSRTVKRRGCGAGGVEAEDDERGRRGRRPTGKVGGVARGRPCPSLVRQASSYGRKPCRCGRRMEPSDGGLRSGSSSGSEANGLPGAEGSRTVRRRGCSAGGGEAARSGGAGRAMRGRLSLGPDGGESVDGRGRRERWSRGAARSR